MNRPVMLTLALTTFILWVPMLSWAIISTFWGCEMLNGALTCPVNAPHNMVKWVPWAILTTPLAVIMTIVLAIYMYRVTRN